MADSQRVSLGDRDVDQAITALKKGAYLLKYGRRGKPKFCPFRLSSDESALIWYHGKDERQLDLRVVSRIIPGQRTAIFKRYPRPEKEYQSFSLIYNDRSLDLICKDKDEAEVWFVGLKALISRGSVRHLRTDGRIESIDRPDTKKVYPSIPLEQGEHPRVESLPQSRLGKAFADIVTYTAVNKGHTQSENKLPTRSENNVQTQLEQVVNSHSSPPSIALENTNGRSSNARSSNGRSSVAETFRISLSSIVSSSSQGSYREDFEALCDVLIWGEGVGDGVLGGGVHKVGSTLSMNINALLPKSLESATALDVHNIACGGKHAMLVTKQGEIFSWGEEEGGRLGHGIEDDIPQPKLIDTLSGLNIEFVACGEYHSCAVTYSGDLFTWGDGTYRSGLLGHGNLSNHCIPRKVYGLMDGIRVSHISCGPWHTAVVTSTGQLYTFGDGTFGALGHGDRTSTSTPRQVETLRGLHTTRAACGVWHTVAVVEVMTGEEEMTPLGKLFTWGDGDKGQLGHGDKKTKLVPECVAGTDDVSFCQVACGNSLTVALTSSGRVYTMGSKVHGQLGNPSANGITPTRVEGEISEYFVEEIACGSHHVAVLTSKTEVYTWGKGVNGQLGHGDSNDRNTPTPVSFLKDKQVKKVFCGANFSAAIYLHKLASSADNSICSGCRHPFNFRRKRHNCYNCGLVFCKVCSSRKSLKASLAPTTTKPYRVCDDCFSKLKRLPETGHVARIPKLQSINSLKKSNEAAEKETRLFLLPGQFSRLSSSDSMNPSAEGKISKKNLKDEMSDTRLFPGVNGNIVRGSISFGATKNTLSPSPPGSRIISRTPSPVSRLSMAQVVGTSDASLGESKQKNGRLTEEIVKLKTQIQDLTRKYQTLEAELNKKEKKLKEATEAAANEAEKCRAAKEVIKSLTKQLKEMSGNGSEKHIVNKTLDSVARQHTGDLSSPSCEHNEASPISPKVQSEKHIVNKRLDSVARQHIGDPSSPSNEHNEASPISPKFKSEKHIVNKRLDSVARQHIGDPSSPSSKHNEASPITPKSKPEKQIVNKRLESVARQDIDDPSSPCSEHNEASPISPKSESTINSSDSPLSNGRKATNDKGEWVVQDEPGVYITLSYLGEGRHELKRVRFSRKRFTEEQAEKWWAENAVKVCERHNIRSDQGRK